MSDAAVAAIVSAIALVGVAVINTLGVVFIALYTVRKANAAELAAKGAQAQAAETHNAVNGALSATLAAITDANTRTVTAATGQAHAEGVSQGEQLQRDRSSPAQA